MPTPPDVGGAAKLDAIIEVLSQVQDSAAPGPPQPRPLALEFEHARRALANHEKALRWLTRRGVAEDGLHAAGGIGVAGIEPLPDGLYAPCPDGRPAFLQPAYGRVRPPRQPVVDPDAPVPIDLVAWRPDAPGRWWLRRGVAVVLGEIALEHAEAFDDVVVVQKTPFDWLRAGGAGVCVLQDWPTATGFYLRGLRLLAKDLRHGDDLEGRLQWPRLDLPSLFVPRDSLR